MITKEDKDLILQNVDLTNPDEFFSRFDVLDECMGNITRFWDGKSDDIDNFSFAILGFPQGIGIRNMGGKEGARDGPAGFRKAFYKLPNYFEKKEGLLLDLGNIKIDLDSDLPSIHKRLIEIIPILAKYNIFPIILGGGNDVTYAGVRGLKESSQVNRLGLVTFDAHLNLHEVPEKFISASSMQRIMSEFPDLIKCSNVVYFGSRKETISPHYARHVLDNNMHIFYKDKISNLQRDLLQGLNLANFECDGVIISFDMDCCDAGMFPGTSFPIPGGFNSDEIIEIAKSLSKFRMGVYLDIINLNPEEDRNDITSGMAALFLFHYLEKK